MVKKLHLGVLIGDRGTTGGTTGASACGEPALGESDAITPEMPIFILSGIRNGMGVSTGNSEEPVFLL